MLVFKRAHSLAILSFSFSTLKSILSTVCIAFHRWGTKSTKFTPGSNDWHWLWNFWVMPSEYHLLYQNLQFSFIKVQVSHVMLFLRHWGFLNIKQLFSGRQYLKKKTNPFYIIKNYKATFPPPSYILQSSCIYCSYEKECK